MPGLWGQVEPNSHSVSARPFWPRSRQNGRSYAAYDLGRQRVALRV